MYYRAFALFCLIVFFDSMQELLTIATCEMKEEDMEAQCLFWDSLNEVMEKNGCEPRLIFVVSWLMRHKLIGMQ